MSSCKCFNQEVTGRSLIERLPASTCQCTSKARLMVEENGRKFVLIVSDWKNVEKIKVDGALICNQEKEKCDYFFFYYPSGKTKNDRHAYFVELKGKNIGKAMSQIISTIQCFMQEGLLKNISLQKAFIVSSRFPQKDRGYIGQQAVFVFGKTLETDFAQFGRQYITDDCCLDRRFIGEFQFVIIQKLFQAHPYR